MSSRWNLGKETPEKPKQEPKSQPKRESTRPDAEELRQAAEDLRGAPRVERRQPKVREAPAPETQVDRPPLGTYDPPARRVVSPRNLGLAALAVVLFAASGYLILNAFKSPSERFGPPVDLGGRPVEDAAYLIAVDRGASPSLEDLNDKREPHRDEARARLLIAFGDAAGRIAGILEKVDAGRQPDVSVLQRPFEVLPSPESRLIDRTFALAVEQLTAELNSFVTARTQAATRRAIEAELPAVDLKSLAARLRAEGLVALEQAAGDAEAVQTEFPELGDAASILADLRGELTDGQLAELLSDCFGPEDAAFIQDLRPGN